MDTANLWTIHKPRYRWRGEVTTSVEQGPLPTSHSPLTTSREVKTSRRVPQQGASFLAMGTGAAHRQGVRKDPGGGVHRTGGRPGTPAHRRGPVPGRPMPPRGNRDRAFLATPTHTGGQEKKPRTGADRWWLTPRPPSAHRNAWRRCQSVSASGNVAIGVSIQVNINVKKSISVSHKARGCRLVGSSPLLAIAPTLRTGPAREASRPA